MSYAKLAANSYVIDVFISPNESPTGKAIRVRKRFKGNVAKAAALDAEINAALRTNGRWVPGAAAKEEARVRTSSRPSRRKGTLRDAANLAWSDPEEGWHHLRDGMKQKRMLEECLKVVGASKLCQDVDRSDYDAIRLACAEKGNSESTVTRKLQAFYRALYYADREGWRDGRPKWKRRVINNQRLFTFDEDFEQELLAYFKAVEARGDDMPDMLTLGIECGFRLGEILTMTGSRVQLVQRLVTIPGELSKDGLPAVVVLTDKALAILKRRVKEHGADVLFPGWTHEMVALRMRAAREHFGIEDKDFVFHATRHTCGTRMAASGVGLLDIMAQLRHKTAAMSQRYIHMTAEARRRNILEKMNPGSNVVPLARQRTQSSAR